MPFIAPLALAGVSANYSNSPETIGALGGSSTSASYSNVAAAGGIAGVATGPAGATSKSGYIGQLFEVVGLVLNSPLTQINEGGTLQLGAGLLYFGWFGFNAGSALAANGAAALAFTNTLFAPGAALAVWMSLDAYRTGRVTAVGAATAIVIGLVVITPAAGFVSPISAIAMGALGALPSYFAIVWRARTRLDDSLDVFGAHGIGGITGALLTGVFAEARWGGTNGLLFGHAAQVGIQAVGVIATIGYSAVGTLAVLYGSGDFGGVSGELMV